MLDLESHGDILFPMTEYVVYSNVKNSSIPLVACEILCNRVMNLSFDFEDHAWSNLVYHS